MIRQLGGIMLLVGVGGSDRQSLFKVATHIGGLKGGLDALGSSVVDKT